MRNGHCISVIIPALNEEPSISLVLQALPQWIDQVIVVDNGSTDNTASIAAALGADVVREPVRGYGRACLSGMARLETSDIVVFLDADFSDDPSEMSVLVDHITEDHSDLVVGVRVPDTDASGALSSSQRAGNAIACWMIDCLWNHRFHDLGPFRAIRSTALSQLDMRDEGYGWTVEMQIKAIVSGLRIVETPVRYRDRVGVSKISGTVRGVIGAGCKIVWTILKHGLRSRKKRYLA